MIMVYAAPHTIDDAPLVRVSETTASKRWLRIAIGFQIAAIVIAFASLGFFVFGMFEMRDAITALHSVADGS